MDLLHHEFLKSSSLPRGASAANVVYKHVSTGVNNSVCKVLYNTFKGRINICTCTLYV